MDASTSGLECHTEPDPDTGLPVKHCVKLHKRLLNCPGRPPVTDEEHHEETAYGDATPSMGMDMMYVVIFPDEPAASPMVTRVHDKEVGQALEDFLQLAEEIQNRLTFGSTELDYVPPAVPVPTPSADKSESLLSRIFKFRRRGRAEKGRRLDERAWQDYAKDCTEI